MELAGVEIAAPDVAASELLLGVAPAPLAGGGRRFALERGTVDVVPGEGALRALCVARRERLRAAGVDVSPIRVGLRPGTSVASVRSGTAGVPTLLLQADA